MDQLNFITNHVSSAEEIITTIANGENTEEKAIALLIQTLSHHHASVRAAAIEALVKLAPASVQPLMIAYDHSSDQGLQAHIIQGLAQIGDSAASDLLAKVVGTTVANHCQGNVRRIAARGLGRISHNCEDSQIIDRAVEKLTWALLTPDDWGLRYAAAVALEEIATAKARSSLELALSKESDPVVLARITAALNHYKKTSKNF